MGSRQLGGYAAQLPREMSRKMERNLAIRMRARWGPGQGQRSLRETRRITGLFMVLPATLTILLLVAFPMIYLLYLSLHSWSGSLREGPQFIGLDNYRTLLLSDERFQAAVVRTFVYTVAAITLEVILGVALAVFLNREFWGRGLVRTLFLLPFMATPVVIALIWVMMYSPAIGVFNYILQSLNLPTSEWSYSSRTALVSLAIVDIWQYTPMVMLIALAGLASLPTEPIECALVDGATPWQAFWYITLPLLRPTIAIAVIFRAIDTLKVFDVIFALTQGGPGWASETLNIYAFFTNFQYLRFGYGSSLLILFVILILGTSLILIKLRREIEAES